jgi:subtilisin-like proprotein convertase family protein
LTITTGDTPPLSPGRYFIAVHNPNQAAITLRLSWEFRLDFANTAPQNFGSLDQTELLDDVLTNSYNSRITLNNDQRVADVRVGVRIDHPRVSDLVLHLVSPAGHRVLLAENRGFFSTNGFGIGTNAGEIAYATFSEKAGTALVPVKFASAPGFVEFITPELETVNYMSDTEVAFSGFTRGDAREGRRLVPTGLTAGTLVIDYDFIGLPDQMQVFYEGVLREDTGMISGSGTISVDYNGSSEILEIVMNGGVTPNQNTRWEYTVTIFDTDGNEYVPPPRRHDQMANSLAVKDRQLYVAGKTGANAENGIVARFALPLQDEQEPYPIWNLNWPDNRGGTRFNGIAVSDEGVYVAGASYTRTADPLDPKEHKGVMVKFPLDRPLVTLASPEGSIWDVQVPEPPGAFPFSGFEELHATTVAFEGGDEFIYATGNGEADASTPGRLFLSKLDPRGTNIWTIVDSDPRESSGRAIRVHEGEIYVAGFSSGSPGVVNPLLMKFDPSGGLSDSWPSGLIGQYNGITSFGEFIYVVGFVDSITTGADFLIEKFHVAGNLIWSRSYDGDGDDDILHGVVAYGDRLYAAGSSRKRDADADIALLEIEQDTGDLVTRGTNYFGMTFYDAAGDDDIGRAIAMDGFDVYIAGEAVRLKQGTQAPGVTSSNLLLNPSFEEPGFPGPSTIRFPQSNEITGWTVSKIVGQVANNQLVAWLRGDQPIWYGVNRDHGDYYINLDGSSFYGYGTIQQSFSTMVGVEYEVAFSLNSDFGTPANDILQVDVAGTSQTFSHVTPNGWDRYQFRFIANSTTATLHFRNLDPTGVRSPFIDNVSVVRALPDIDLIILRYRVQNDYLPEETLRTMVGEYAGGDWLLEVRDTRTGAINDPATLLSWQLQIDLTRTNAASYPLRPNETFVGTARGSNLRYFTLYAPYTASEATITLTNLLNAAGAPNLNLHFNQGGPPFQTIGSPDITLLANVSQGLVRLDSTTPTTPSLIPGQQFYLAVENADPSAVNDFELTVRFNNTAVTYMSGSQMVSAALPGGTAGQNLYQFNLNSGAAKIAFQLANLTGDVEVLLRRGSLPTQDAHDLRATFTATSSGQILIEPTAAMPNIGGTWFATVRNLTSTPATYTVQIVNLDDGGRILRAFPFIQAGSGFSLLWESVPGETYEIEASFDLIEWETISSITAEGATTTFTDPTPNESLPLRFYRIKELP